MKKAGDEMTGRLQLKNAAEFSIRMQGDTSNYRRGIIWNNAASDTIIAEIGYQNTVRRIFLNPLGSTEVWSDAAGKYSFIIGNNFLTYNTWTILHSNNSTNYASGSVKVANTSADNINNTNRAGSSRVNFFDIYSLGSTMPATYGNIMEICSTRSMHWQPQLFFGGWVDGHIFYRNKSYPETGYGPWKQLIDSENYSSILNSTYVKKAGDTMTGTLTVGGHITPSTTFTYDLGATSAAWNRVYSNIFVSKIATGTQPFQCVSTTTCTNLNADLLDGFHGSEISIANTYVRRSKDKYISVNYINSDTAKNENHDFTQIITTDDGDNYYRKAGIRFFMKRLNSYTKTIDLKSLDANKYYPISFQLVQRKSFIRIKIWNCIDGNKPTWATHPNGFAAAIEWDTTASGWGAQDTQRIIYADNYKFCDKSPCGGIEQNTMASVEIVYLRGGAIYYYNNNDNIEAIINSNGYSWTDSTYSYSAPVINNIKNRAYSCYNLSLRSFSTLYCNDIISYRLNISSTSTFGETATFNGGMYSGNIFPLSNNNYSIGSNSNRFTDAYIQTWVYANQGLFISPSGITQNGSYLELSSGGNGIIIAGGTDFYVNYRGASYGGRSVPKKWYWRAGSSSSWANMEFGDCTLHGWINSTGITASGPYGYNVGARFANTSHDSIEIVGGNYTMGLGCHSSGLWYWWRGNANPTSSTNKWYVMEYDGSTWAFTGSITATAAITAKATSDFRLKENYDGLIDYRERLLKLGRVYDYNYNKKALDLYQDRIDNKRHTGLVYQNAVKAGITNFCHEKDEYGYGSLNYLSPDLIATIIGSVQANILSIRLVESEQERMRKELEHAKSEINRLKGLVASLQN